ncbi:hypothetical protein PAXRUDRAFT_170354 [Paxillus rubicundulus Ve08.2h10]|uniref:Uncharacterized protein n=1 Tax=Paxillus rubicundulus Ve08.2h10 TaxID=930991 RepID=A0A0D0DF61_9AGAM|nr:hypothetical protein PAXRUDRAFT_170354 [Paxillus rubicundulus Ve08.2h10]
MFNTYNLIHLSPTLQIPYHISILLSYPAWVYELILGHPDRIQHSLGVNLDIFDALLCILHCNEISQS